MDKIRLQQLVEARNQIDRELAQNGLSIEDGKVMVTAQFSPQQEREMIDRHNAAELRETVKEINEYLSFQSFNIGTRFPGWMGRLNESWGGKVF